MGCDIHCEIERKAPGDEYWRPIDWQVVKCEFCHGSGINSGDHWKEEMRGKPCHWCAVRPSAHDYGLRNWAGEPGKRRERWLYWRNYSRFAILADVRNGFGFAGVDTGDGFRPISQPRGLPEVKGIYPDDDDYRFGDHSFSWLSIEEVLNYDWSQTTVRRGVVGAEQFKVWESEGKPTSWSGLVVGPSISHVSNAEMRLAIASGKTKGVHTQVAWESTYAEEFGLEQLAALKDLRESLEGEIRLVFGFDS